MADPATKRSLAAVQAVLASDDDDGGGGDDDPKVALVTDHDVLQALARCQDHFIETVGDAIIATATGGGPAANDHDRRSLSSDDDADTTSKHNNNNNNHHHRNEYCLFQVNSTAIESSLLQIGVDPATIQQAKTNLAARQQRQQQQQQSSTNNNNSDQPTTTMMTKHKRKAAARRRKFTEADVAEQERLMAESRERLKRGKMA
jgi:hypothetical protein